MAHVLALAPDEKKAKFILKQNPHLLHFEFKEVIFPLYKCINMTPAQLVYGSGDYEMLDQVIKPLFIEQYGEEKGIAELQKEIDVMQNVHKPFDFGPIIKTISEESFNQGNDDKNRLLLSPVTLTAIQKFRKDFAANQPKIIDKGVQFRWETLVELCEEYRNAAQQWNDDYLKCSLFEDAVIGWVLQYVTQYAIQNFNQGLLCLEHEQFERMPLNRQGLDFYKWLCLEAIELSFERSCPGIIAGNDNTGLGCAPENIERLQNFCLAIIKYLQNYAHTNTHVNTP